MLDLRLDQEYLRSQAVNSEEGAPMGIGIWYEMWISDPVAYLFRNTDPRGSLRANVSSATVRCLSNMPLANMLGWMTRGIDVICVAVENREGLSPVLRKARAKGIRVVTWDADAEKDARDFFINQATPQGIGHTLTDEAARITGGRGDFAIITASLSAAMRSMICAPPPVSSSPRGACWSSAWNARRRVLAGCCDRPAATPMRTARSARRS